MYSVLIESNLLWCVTLVPVGLLSTSLNDLSSADNNIKKYLTLYTTFDNYETNAL